MIKVEKPRVSAGISLGSIGSTPNADGATLSGSVLNLEPASASFGGIITTGTQTFAGAKTFSSSIVGSAGLSIVGAGSFSASSAGMVFGGATTVYSSVSISTSAGSTLATGIGSARVLMGTAPVTTFTSGTHPLIAGLVLKPQTITNAGATVTNTATLYVESEGAGGTNNYAAWFDSGAVRIDGTIELGAASDTTISRSSAGVIAVEGVVIPSISSTNTLTNKTLIATSNVLREMTAITDSATPTPTGGSLFNTFDVTALAQAAAFAAPSGTPANWNSLVIRIKDNGTARALTWDSIYVAGGVALPSTTVLSKILTLGFFYNTANSLNKWQCIASAQEA